MTSLLEQDQVIQATPTSGRVPLPVTATARGLLATGLRTPDQQQAILYAAGKVWHATRATSRVPGVFGTNPNFLDYKPEIRAYNPITGELLHRIGVSRAINGGADLTVGGESYYYRPVVQQMHLHNGYIYALNGMPASQSSGNGSDAEVDKINPSTGQVVATLRIPALNRSVIVGDTLWVVGNRVRGADTRLTEIDLLTFTVKKSQPIYDTLAGITGATSGYNYNSDLSLNIGFTGTDLFVTGQVNGNYNPLNVGLLCTVNRTTFETTRLFTFPLSTSNDTRIEYFDDKYWFFNRVTPSNQLKGIEAYFPNGQLAHDLTAPGYVSGQWQPYRTDGTMFVGSTDNNGTFFYTFDFLAREFSGVFAQSPAKGGFGFSKSSSSVWIAYAGTFEDRIDRLDISNYTLGEFTGDIFEWTFTEADGTTDSQTTGLPSVAHTFTQSGTAKIDVMATSISKVIWADTPGRGRTQTITLTAPPPVTAVIAADPLSGYPALDVHFDGTGSTSSLDPITSYEWDFGDGETATGAVVNHTYGTPGARTVTLTVSTASGSDTDTVVVNVIAAQVQTAHVPTADLLDTIRWSHRAYSRVVLRTPECQDYVLPLVGGSITIDRNAKTFRSADLDIAIDALGTDQRTAIERLTVQSGEVLIYAGTIFEDNRNEEVLVGRLRVDSLERTDSAVAKVTAYDYSLMLDEHPVDPAMGSKIPKGTDWRVAIRRLIEDTFTWKPCGMSTMFVVDPAVPAWPIEDQAWDNVNRLNAIMEWAESRNCWFYNLPDGRFFLTPANENTEPVWTVDTGTGGVLVRATQRYSREEQYNAVAISFDLPDAANQQVRAFAVDDDPTSTTRWGGPFGKRVLNLSNVPAASVVEAEAIARRKLAENKGATRALTLTTVRNPALIPGQVITVVHPLIGTERHIIERVTHQLNGGTSDIDCKLRRS